jgi:hypothetical protein
MTIADEQENAALEAEAKARGLQPWQVLAMRATPDNLMRDLVADSRTRASEPRSMAVLPESEPNPVTKGTGWAEPAPLQPPPGQDLIDRLCSAQDRTDRLAELQKLGIDQLQALQKAVRDRIVELAADKKLEK